MVRDLQQMEIGHILKCHQKDVAGVLLRAAHSIIEVEAKIFNPNNRNIDKKLFFFFDKQDM